MFEAIRYFRQLLEGSSLKFHHMKLTILVVKMLNMNRHLNYGLLVDRQQRNGMLDGLHTLSWFHHLN